MIPLHHFLIHSVCNNFLCFEVGIRVVEVTTLKNEGVKFVHHKKNDKEQMEGALKAFVTIKQICIS